MPVLVIWILGVFRELKRVVLGVVWFCVFILLCKPCKPLVWRLEGLEEEVLELPQLGHVRLDEDAAVEGLPPRGGAAQVEPEGAHQPRGPRGHADVVEVLGDGDGLARVDDHGDDLLAAVEVEEAEKVLDAEGGVAAELLAVGELEHPGDAEAERGGLGEEDLRGAVARRDQIDALDVQLEGGQAGDRLQRR